jgi:NADPH-dependent curcumin reductase CurA
MDIQAGLENALDVFVRLFDGSNQGKLVLQISDPEKPEA